MKKIFSGTSACIGNTPLVQIDHYCKQEALLASILLKLEYFNPAGSVKDRAAYFMIEAAEQEGQLKEGAVIIEPTSGNTGIGLAFLAAQRGYKAVFVMPESMSVERRKLLKAYGAEIVLTPAAEGMKGAIAKANDLAQEIENSFVPGQFTNPANPLAHYKTTGPEIWRDTNGEIDIFVAGVGTGGTISGTGKYLKEQNRAVQIVAVEPESSPVLSGGAPGPNKIQGVGAGFIPEILDQTVIDTILPVAAEDAYESVRLLAKTEGILVGISSGAALYAATILAKKEENKGKRIVALMPDNGERYLSTDLFSE